MECEILFRGKDNNIKGIDWVYGYYVKCKSPLGGINHMIYSGDIEYDCTKECYFPTEAVRNYVDPATVGRYTGLTDKNGKKIFEGDIVLVSPGFIEDTPFKLEVRYGPCGGVKNVEHGVGYIGFFFNVITSDSCIKTWLRTDPIYFLEAGLDVEVIGNIHDNPELLEVQG